MTVILFLLIQGTAILGVNVLEKKFPADPELRKVAAHERSIDARREWAQESRLPVSR